MDNLENQPLDVQAEAQAKQIAGLLDANAKRLSMRTLKQLENARSRAVTVHARQFSGATVHADGTLGYFGAWLSQHRLALASLALLIGIGGYFAMQSTNNTESSDAFLLGAELPPEAFVDKGFEPSLNVPAVHAHQKSS